LRASLDRQPDQLAAIGAWLHGNVYSDWPSVGVRPVFRASGGTSYETWVVDLDAEAADTGPQRVVLRIEPTSGPLAPYDISYEARVLRALAPTSVPVPRLIAHCSDEGVIGRPFVVMEFIEGDILQYRTIMSQPYWQDQGIREQLTDEFVRLLAEIQRVDVSTAAFREAFGAPRASEQERMCRIVDEMVAVATSTLEGWPAYPLFADAARWLKRNVPACDPADMVLVHGDYKLGNSVWRDYRIISQLDWEGAMMGHPMQDLGYACHPSMRMAAPTMIAMLAPLDDILARYERHTGRAVDLSALSYYVIYALFFHVWTVLVGIPSTIESDGDIRYLGMYGKLSEVTHNLVAQMEAHEEGGRVL
jgi:aminoglycoside phosphotransferase (APT) family kinase protein